MAVSGLDGHGPPLNSPYSISGGSNVYRRDVEEVLLTHPSVAGVAVLSGSLGVARDSANAQC